MKIQKPGTQFETVVADIQAQIDPNAEVLHDEFLIDRLGQKRQFDVVIKGKFAGQEILGIIECKDLNRRVGTPAIDAFVTKANDINANFKILVSRKGFTDPAIAKAKHYGIQTLSLIPDDKVNYGFKVGNYWHANIYHWGQLSLRLLFLEDPKHKVTFDAQDIKIGEYRIIDWFTNYLLEKHPTETNLGWVVNIGGYFDTPQMIHVNDKENYLCKGLEFQAKREVLKKKLFVGITGTGFFDWQKSQATVPPKTTITSDAVPTDFSLWDDRNDYETHDSNSINITMIAHNSQFEHIDDVIDLDNL